MMNSQLTNNLYAATAETPQHQRQEHLLPGVIDLSKIDPALLRYLYHLTGGPEYVRSNPLGQCPGITPIEAEQIRGHAIEFLVLNSSETTHIPGTEFLYLEGAIMPLTTLIAHGVEQGFMSPEAALSWKDAVTLTTEDIVH